MIPETKITFRLTTEFKDKLIEDAQQAGMELSEYLRMRLSGDDDTYVRRQDGDVLLRCSDLKPALLNQLHRQAQGQMGDKTLKGRILMYLAKGMGRPLHQLRR